MASVMSVEVYDREHQVGRANWRQSYTAKELAVAAEKAAKYHADRQVWWETERDETKTKIGQQGIEVREQPITGGVTNQVVIDPTLNARLNECQSKIASHRQKAQDLKQWVGFLRISERAVVLTFADVEYFEIGRHD